VHAAFTSGVVIRGKGFLLSYNTPDLTVTGKRR
jgi:hypothetical protein